MTYFENYQYQKQVCFQILTGLVLIGRILIVLIRRLTNSEQADISTLIFISSQWNLSGSWYKEHCLISSSKQ